MCYHIIYFSTLEDCRATCEGKIDVCELPITTGPCSSSFTRWAYDTILTSAAVDNSDTVDVSATSTDLSKLSTI